MENIEKIKKENWYFYFLTLLFLQPYFLISQDHPVFPIFNDFPFKNTISIICGMVFIPFIFNNISYIRRIDKTFVFILLFYFSIPLSSVFADPNKINDSIYIIWMNILSSISMISIILAGIIIIKKYGIKTIINVLGITIALTMFIALGEVFYGRNRIGGPYYDPNYFGRLLVIYLCVLVPILVNKSVSKRSAVVFISFMILSSIVLIFMTGSRGSFITLIAVSFIYLIILKKYLSVVLFAALIVPIIIIYTTYLNDSRFTGENYRSKNPVLNSFLDLSNSTRLAYNIIAFKAWLDNPLIGVGYGNFQNYIQQYYVTGIPFALNVKAVHNWLLGVLVEQGIVGGISFSLAIYFPIRKLVKRNNDEKLVTRHQLVLIMLTFIIHGLFFPPFGQEYLFVYLYSIVLGQLNV